MSNLGTPTKFGSVWIVIIAAAVLIVWDVYAAMSTVQPTISAFFLNYAMRHPILPFAMGVLCGHLAWYQEIDKKDE